MIDNELIQTNQPEELTMYEQMISNIKSSTKMTKFDKKEAISHVRTAEWWSNQNIDEASKTRWINVNLSKANHLIQ